jgi:LuxR family quorum sensing-dependent transcriptional regulator
MPAFQAGSARMSNRQHSVREFIEELDSKLTIEETWTSFLSFASHYGFTNGGIAEMPGPRQRIEDTTMCLSWPPEWKQRYFTQNYVAEDPAQLHLSRCRLPYTWNEMLACPYYSARQRQIVHEASEFGLNVGYIVPIRQVGCGPAMVTIAGAKVELAETAQMELHLAAMYAHAHVRCVSQANRETQLVPPLGPRERECLQWVADGKTDWEISEILSISEKTANTYIERAKQKFGVATRMQAVVHGLRAGQIKF